MGRRGIPTGITLLLLVVAAWSEGTGAQDACLSADGTALDVSPSTVALRYTGPQQHVAKHFRCFHGQHWEDIYAFQHLLHGVGNGFFIELGALDGYGYSVTYFYEIFQQWRGLLIEASPQNHVRFQVQSKRLKDWQRRKVPYVKAAVCGEPEGVTYVSKEGTGAGILEYMSKEQQERNHKMCTTRQLKEDETLGRDDCVFTRINCVHLGNLLEEKGVTHVDLFILDVEGAEAEVLKTLDLDVVPVRYFLIELDGSAPAKDAAVRCKLRRAGFEPMGRLDLNELWVNRRFPHDRFAAEYTTISADRWARCFRGSVDSHLKPLPWFNSSTTSSRGAGSSPELPDPLVDDGIDEQTVLPPPRAPRLKKEVEQTVAEGLSVQTLIGLAAIGAVAAVLYRRRNLARSR
jgi:FkbM family methyltransferase